MKRDEFSAAQSATGGWPQTLILPRAAGPAALAGGTRVGEVEIDRVIGEGSAGIVYLAIDPSLQRRVAVKEYLPPALASRAVDGQVVVRSATSMPAFRAGLDGFIAEARLLARFEHPSLVKVYRVWEANGTAYVVMPYYEGPTLTRLLAGRDDALDEAALRGLLMPLLEALEMIHGAGQLHRDISADNILMTPTGPVLLDFGVARRAIGGLTHTPTVVLKRGYAPIEQYGESESLKPGPWSDLYALGSVLHLAITGQAPTISVERLWDDWLEPLAATAAGRFSPALLAAVDAMLAVRPTDRPQDVASLRRLLDAEPPKPAMPLPFADIHRGSPADPVTAIERTPTVAPAAVAQQRRQAPMIVAIGLALLIGLGLSVRALTASVEQAEAPRAAPTAPPVPVRVAAPVPVPATTLPVAALAPQPKAITSVVQPAPVAVRAAAPRQTAPVETARPASPPPSVAEPAPATVHVATSAHWPARCFDILQKASLEHVSDDETLFLRDSCK